MSLTMHVMGLLSQSPTFLQKTNYSTNKLATRLIRKKLYCGKCIIGCIVLSAVSNTLLPLE